MLRKTFIFSLLSLTMVITLFIINLLKINKDDIENFNNIDQKNLSFDSEKSYQKREDVQKDLYIIEKNTRKHYQIFSKISEIFLNRNNQKYEIIENLNSIKFLCLEDFLDNTSLNQIKHIKYITADYGSYLFPSHKFTLFDVNLSFINTLNFENFDSIDFEKAYFKGKATELDFSIKQKKPIIKALSFTGSFNPKKGLKCEN